MQDNNYNQHLGERFTKLNICLFSPTDFSVLVFNVAEFFLAQTLIKNFDPQGVVIVHLSFFTVPLFTPLQDVA